MPSPWKTRAAFTCLVWLLAATASIARDRVDIEDGVHQPGSHYSSVNGSVRIGRNAEVGDLNAVNGSIEIGEDSVVGTVDSVNGGVRLASGASAVDVGSVNGTVHLDRSVRVERSVDTVNGKLSALQGTEIGGNVETVNGSIELDGTLVGGDVETYHGDIRLEGSTEIRGDLYVRKSRGDHGRRNHNRPTEIWIGPGVTVQGDLYFEKPVELHVDPTASIGTLHGTEFVRNQS